MTPPPNGIDMFPPEEDAVVLPEVGEEGRTTGDEGTLPVVEIGTGAVLLVVGTGAVIGAGVGSSNVDGAA